MEEINLYDLLKYYAKNWLILLSAIFVGAIIGLVYTGFVQTPLYKSEATMLVVGSRTAQDSTINNNYTELFKSRRVLNTVIEAEGYSGDYNQLVGRTTATNEKDTDVIRVSIADTDARKSEQLLAASLDVFKEEATGLYGSNATGTSNIKTVDTANVPIKAYNVNVLLQIGLAVSASFFLAIIVLFFIYDYRSSQAPPATKSGSVKKPKSTRPKNAKQTKDKPAASKAKTTEPVRRRSFYERAKTLLVGIPVEPTTTKSKANKTK